MLEVDHGLIEGASVSGGNRRCQGTFEVGLDCHGECSAALAEIGDIERGCGNECDGSRQEREVGQLSGNGERTQLVELNESLVDVRDDVGLGSWC